MDEGGSVRAAAYARYSSDNQRQESAEVQLEDMQRYADNNGITITQTYIDMEITATKDERVEFQKMIKDSERGLFDIILVHKLDRFARSRYDSAIYKQRLKKNNVRVISITEKLDGSPESIMMESMLEGMAEYYSANLRREVFKGMRSNASKGRLTGGNPPFGYDVLPDKTLIINEHNAEAVRKMFEMRSQEKSYDAICKWINDRGYVTWTGKPMTRATIRSILKNEKYKGDMVYNKTSRSTFRMGGYFNDPTEYIIHKGVIPAIVSEELWNKVNKMFKKQEKGGSNMNKAQEIYLLSGKIFCGKCGGSMVGNRRKINTKYKTGGSYYSDYQCLNRKRKHGCDQKAIKKEKIEGLVLDHLEKYVFSDEAINSLANKLSTRYAEMKSESKETIKLFQGRLDEINSKIDNLVMALANGISAASVKEKLESLENDRLEITWMIEDEKRRSSLSMGIEDIKKYLAIGRGIKFKELDEQRAIISQYVDRVTVFEDQITIDLYLTPDL